MKFELQARLRATIDVATREQHANDIADLIREISDLNGVELASVDDRCSAVHLNLTDAQAEPVTIASGRVDVGAPLAAFDVTAAVTVNPDCVFRDLWITPGEAREAFLQGNALRRFDEALATLALATYITRPNQCHFLSPKYTPDPGDDFESNVGWGHMGRGVLIAQEIGWPPLHRLPIRDALMWLSRLSGWNEGIGRGAVGRAVAAFSQAISLDRHTTTGLSLLWAMIGLEALYCRGTEGLKAQLKEKSQLLLGAFKTHKRRFGQVYDFRSSFIHGTEDAPFAHRYRSEDASVWDHVHKSHEEASLALVTLLASIQQLIIRDWHHLEYSLSIINPRDA